MPEPREIFMLEHNGRLCFEFGSFRTEESAVAASRDSGVRDVLRPAVTLKYFAPAEYERLCTEWKPPTVVRFREFPE